MASPGNVLHRELFDNSFGAVRGATFQIQQIAVLWHAEDSAAARSGLPWGGAIHNFLELERRQPFLVWAGSPFSCNNGDHLRSGKGVAAILFLRAAGWGLTPFLNRWGGLAWVAISVLYFLVSIYAMTCLIFKAHVPADHTVWPMVLASWSGPGPMVRPMAPASWAPLMVPAWPHGPAHGPSCPSGPAHGPGPMFRPMGPAP